MLKDVIQDFAAQTLQVCLSIHWYIVASHSCAPWCICSRYNIHTLLYSPLCSLLYLLRAGKSKLTVFCRCRTVRTMRKKSVRFPLKSTSLPMVTTKISVPNASRYQRVSLIRPLSRLVRSFSWNRKLCHDLTSFIASWRTSISCPVYVQVKNHIASSL